MVGNNQPCFHPHLGVAVFVTSGEQVLFGKPGVEAGEFRYQLPGGWLKNGENFEYAARREVREETGLELVNPQFVAITNNIFFRAKHFIPLCFEAECVDPDVVGLLESVKCKDWIWKGWSEVSNQLYLPLQLFKNSDYRPFSVDKQSVHVSV